jgi:hypothetical protein
MKLKFTPAVIALTTFVVSASLFLNGCKKDVTADTETTSATDNNICESEFTRLMPTVNKIAIDESGVHRLSSGNQVASTCPTVSIDTPNQFPLVMTLDFGTGCTDPVDGKVRSGRIRCTIDRPWDSTGCITTLSLDTFFVGGVQYEGTATFTRNSATAFHQVIPNGKCTKTGAAPWTILYDCDRTIEFTSGANNSTQPQIITVSGINHGTDRNGTTWTANITSPIVRDLSCTWLTQGTVDLTPNGKATRTINFGTGTCDNKGTVTIEGNTFEFTMQ